jgi:hypothetical protein
MACFDLPVRSNAALSEPPLRRKRRIATCAGVSCAADDHRNSAGDVRAGHTVTVDAGFVCEYMGAHGR